MFENVAAHFRHERPNVDFCSLRVARERSQDLSVRQGVLQPVGNVDDFGAMVVVHHQGGVGYGATADLSRSGIRRAIAMAQTWAERTAAISVTNFSAIPMPHPRGVYETPIAQSWDGQSLTDKITLLQSLAKRLKTDTRIVDWEASLWWTNQESLYLTSDGGEVGDRPGIRPAIEVAQSSLPGFRALRGHGTPGQRQAPQLLKCHYC